MAYFQYLPKLRYPSLSKKSDDYEYQTVTNLFRRGKVRDDVFNESILFNKYKIEGDDRPDNVAYKVYNDSDLDWIVLLSNNIINIRDEWPMTQLSFENYMQEKYSTTSERYALKHYETSEIRDNDNKLIRPSGIIVSPDSYDDYSFEYFSNGSVKIETNTSLNPVTYDEYEQRLNEDKRTIYVIKPKFVATVIKDLEKIMKYEESSQFINKNLKKTSI